jgi:hypothetical protein
VKNRTRLALAAVALAALRRMALALAVMGLLILPAQADPRGYSADELVHRVTSNH